MAREAISCLVAIMAAMLRACFEDRKNNRCSWSLEGITHRLRSFEALLQNTITSPLEGLAQIADNHRERGHHRNIVVEVASYCIAHGLYIGGS